MAVARAQIFHQVRVLGAMQPYRQTLCALHCCMGRQKGTLAKRKKTDALGIKDQSTGTLFMILGQVNFRLGFFNMYVILLVEV
jgi:hypothetical protein